MLHQPLPKLLFALLAGTCGFLMGTSAGDLAPPGFRPHPAGLHALAGGRVVVRPGQILEAGTVLIRDGLIEAVGTNVDIPAGARVWDMTSNTVYAGFIESYLVLNSTNPPVSTGDSMPIGRGSLTAGGWRFFGAPGDRSDPGRAGPGSALGKINPEARVADNYSPKEKNLSALREQGFTTAVVAPSRGILRGTSALIALTEENPNQAILKPGVFQHIAFEPQDDGSFPSSLMGVIAAVRQTFLDADHYALDRADFEKHSAARRRLEYDPGLTALAAATGKRMPFVVEPGSALMNDRAVRLARELDFNLILISCGQEWRRPDLARVSGAAFIVPVNFPSLPKLPDEADWDQISLDQLRTWDWAPENPALLRELKLEVALTTYGLGEKKEFRKNLRLALDRGLSEEDALAGLTIVPARLCGVEKQLGSIEAGKIANLVIVQGRSYFDPESKVRAVWIDGKIHACPPEPSKPASATKSTASAAPTNATVSLAATNGASNAGLPMKKDKKGDDLREAQRIRVAHSPQEGRGAITNPPALLIRHATIWTGGPAGVLTNAELFVAGGKILAAGSPATPPTNTLILDATGWHITAGIIDCHSHSAILGNVNEMSLPSTAMVRIRDVVNSETPNLHQQLAGGVTAANLLHGSANPIDGQNCVIKLRDGNSPEDLVFSNAPAGIKFALGENPKQSNWGDHVTSRFPQTRMGVQTFIANRFTAARHYLQDWEAYRSTGGLIPRRDLELEAIGEIIQGRRLIHSHSYRQDEILMLLRLMEGFGVRVGTLQHGLEAYKIADEISAHGAGVSTFSDWWAYKFEVYDAIPYNGSLAAQRGVTVSFNSDSSDLARRLYLEAAKAVKYGGTPEAKALNFVTLNPAKQLHIDAFVGSLEPGKDADFAVWSKSPLDSGTVCLQTWIDGRQYFDRALEAGRTARLQAERKDLIAKARKIARLAGGSDDAGNDGGKAFFRSSLEHEFDGRERHCLDQEDQ